MIPQKQQDGSLSQLPVQALHASISAQRTQMIMNLTRDVVQENSAGYWYDLGEKASKREEWSHAIYCYQRCRQTTGDKLRVSALWGLCSAFWSRRCVSVVHGDFDGASLDEEESDKAQTEAEYWYNHKDFENEWFGLFDY